MNAERLLAQFERVADTPDAIPRLQRLILDLAVRGKLVEQDPNDEPAAELLKQIAVEKERLVKEGKIQKQKMLSPVEETERPFDLPNGWDVARLATVSVCLDHMRIPINKTEREQRIAGKPLSDLFPYFGATQQQGWIDDYIFDEELVLLGEDGIPFFEELRSKAYLISGKSWVNNHAHVFRGIFVSNQFLVHCLNVFDYSGRVVGATRAKLNQTRALTIPIMLPPLAEQHRIVAKVDELMALCDQMEAAQVERETKRERLAAASLARLNEPDPETFHDDARFALDALPALTKRPDQIQQLRQTILNLAVRGKLVKQNPNDEPAEELLKRIAAEKARVTKTGKNKKRKGFETSTEIEFPYKIPGSWQWARLSELGLTQTGTTPPKSNKALYGNYIPFIKPADLQSTYVDYSNEGLSNTGAEVSKRIAEAGSILMVCIGTIGKCQLIDQHCSFNQQINAFTPLGELESNYLLSAFKSDFFQKAAWSASARSTIAILNKGNWEKLFLPIPPYAEQHRIVAKVDELMALCDELEASLTSGEETRSRLLDALLAEAIGA